MPFESEFSLNDKLKRCLNNDADHIGLLTLPASDRTGSHVTLIQKALNAFAARIGADRIPETAVYDQTTADMVTTFKELHKPPILNFKNQIDAIVGKKTVDALDKELPRLGAVPDKPDPATDPAEKQRVEALLALHRPGVPVLIARALQTLPKCKAALELAKRSPFQAAQGLRENQLGIDGLMRHFKISGNNLEVIDTVQDSYRKLLEKVVRLPLDQAATDYPTFVSDAPELAFNADGTRSKTPAFSDRQRNKMFFNPIYRPFVPGVQEPFGGLAPVALQAIQLHEMCHFYLNMDDGDPAVSTTARSLQLAQSFQLFAMQLALGRPFP
jgi:hypothetical protein